jgi:hypothetical protein
MTANKMDAWVQSRRIGGLRRFGAAITIFNILGHTVFGFEQSWAQPFVALATTYSVEIFCECMDALAERRRPRFIGNWRNAIDFILPAHITGLAVAMLLYSSDHLLPTVLAAAVAIASKNTLRLRVDGRLKHFLNPSNFGITITLLLFPWVGIAPPYQFTENLPGSGSWILPAVIFFSGSLVNWRFTGRLFLILAWWSGFVLQAALRSLLFGSSWIAALNPMTGVAFILFSFYMVTDPATTPFDKKSQIIFGFSVAAVYGLLVCLHVEFGLFFALTAVSGTRGVARYLRSHTRVIYPAMVPARATTAMRKTA